MPRETLSRYHPDRKEPEPEDSVGLMFPGQGSQRVGMGQDLFKTSRFARETWGKADGVLGFPISEITFKGPPDILSRTAFAQPATLVDSFIRQKLLERAGVIPRKKDLTAGHSLGEYNALVAAGVFSFKDAVWLTGQRGQFMSEACEENPGGMVAVNLGVIDKRLLYIMEQFELEVSVMNSDDQTVLSGRHANLNQANEFMKRNNIVSKPLQVEGAFHSSLMQSAVEKFSRALKIVHIKQARTPIIANTTATIIQTPDEIREELENQLTHCVRWAETLMRMPEKTIEVGESGILSKMMQKVRGGTGKIEKLTESIKGAAVHFVVWRKDPQATPLLA